MDSNWTIDSFISPSILMHAFGKLEAFSNYSESCSLKVCCYEVSCTFIVLKLLDLTILQDYSVNRSELFRLATTFIILPS